MQVDAAKAAAIMALNTMPLITHLYDMRRVSFDMALDIIEDYLKVSEFNAIMNKKVEVRSVSLSVCLSVASWI